MIQDNSFIKEIKQGELLISQEKTCQFTPLILTGLLRIFKISETGREVTLFRSYPGDTCLLNLSCRFGGNDFGAMVQAEGKSTLLMIPESVFRIVLEKSVIWKDFLVKSLYQRLGETIYILEQVAFTRVDQRLVRILLDQANNTGTIYATQEQLATELGTAREVISRLLTELKLKGFLIPKRGKIQILRLEELESLLL